MQPQATIREATEADLPGILSIYNEVISTSTAVYRLATVDFADRPVWLAAQQASSYPVLVAVEGARVLGYAAFSDWNPLAGYRHTATHSLYVADGRRGQGIGTDLMAALMNLARRREKLVLIAQIDSENLGSIRFHHRLGFDSVGTLPAVGRKFDRWLDVILLMRRLDA